MDVLIILVIIALSIWVGLGWVDDIQTGSRVVVLVSKVVMPLVLFNGLLEIWVWLQR